MVKPTNIFTIEQRYPGNLIYKEVYSRFIIKPISLIFLFFAQEWPEDALSVVAQRFLADVNLSADVIRGCVQICKTFHITTRDLSKRFFNELKRNNHVTPTSYLELINTYKNLLAQRQE